MFVVDSHCACGLWFRELHTTPAVQTSSMAVQWLACTETNVERRSLLDSFRFC